MENNIFIKMNKNKFNPDIDKKIKTEEFERNNTKYNMTNIIYNPITGVIPVKVASSNDLILDKDKTINAKDFNDLLKAKELERQNINNINHIKTKIVTEPSINKSNYIETYEELKRPSKSQPNINNVGYNNIMDQLKNLGILN
jgi:hypothetical protein